jgi:hypothetical protein
MSEPNDVWVLLDRVQGYDEIATSQQPIRLSLHSDAELYSVECRPDWLHGVTTTVIGAETSAKRICAMLPAVGGDDTGRPSLAEVVERLDGGLFLMLTAADRVNLVQQDVERLASGRASNGVLKMVAGLLT